MSWAGIAKNQTVSNENLQDAINTGIFTAGSTPIPLTPSPENKKQGTKERVVTYINIPNPNYPPWVGRTNNQLIVKDDIYAEGVFILDPQYGKIFTSLLGTDLPTFTFDVTSVTSQLYYNAIPAQTITVGVSGNAFVTPVRLNLVIDSQLVETKELLDDGFEYITFTLPNTIYAPSEIKISVGSGGVPPVIPIDFSSMPVSAVAVSKTTGQYQIVGAGVIQEFDKYQQGYLYVSSDYGVSWTQKSIPGYWNKVANSANGQYALAVDLNNAVYKSSDYGATFTQITNFPSPYPGFVTSPNQQRFQSCALSANGQYQVITILKSEFPGIPPNFNIYEYGHMYISSDSGSTWTVRRITNAIFNNNEYSYGAVAMNSDGSEIIVVADINKIVKSYNYGVNWVMSDTSFPGVLGDIKQMSMTLDGNTAAYAIFVSPYDLFNPLKYLRATKTADTQFTWYNISPQLSWHGVDVFYQDYGLANIAAGYAVGRNGNYDQLTYIKNITNGLTTTANNTASPLKKYRCIACSDNGQYVLAGANVGLVRSSDFGATWATPSG